MKPWLALPGDLSLAASAPRSAGPGEGFPTDGLEKGLLLLDGEQELSGEGVGFGVPVLKRGMRAAFSGSSRTVVSDDPPSLTRTYRIDRVERLGGRERSHRALAPLDLARESLSLVYRRVPPLRGPITATSSAGRRLLRLRTRFEETQALTELSVTYAPVAPQAEDQGGLIVTVLLGDLPPTVTEVILMNELGAASFDLYEEDGRIAHADGIGAWDRVAAESARFRSSATGVWFELQSLPDPAVPEVRLFRGRELAPGRLSWAGFGYSLRPGPSAFTYTVRFGRDAVREGAGREGRSGS